MTSPDDHPTQALLDGRYRLDACVGRGGTSDVYRAEDVLLGRTVAIKLLLRVDRERGAQDRLHSETAALAALNHPSLVTLYDARLDPAHPQYLAMEYVDGPTLAVRLLRGPLTGTEAALLARDLAEGLHAVHTAGIIHRDVKPSNVLLARSVGSGATTSGKLTDFGIAFALDDARSTSPGMLIGTAAYMAPEQVRAAQLTPAVDVYALGLVLLEALTGTPAYPAAGSIPSALNRLDTPPTIPASLGPDWTALLSGMTRTDPQSRPTALDVARAAQRLAGGAPGKDPGSPGRPDAAAVAATPAPADAAPTKEYTRDNVSRGVAHVRRRRRAVATVCATAAVVIAAAGLWTFGPGSAPLERVTTSTSVTRTPDPAPTAPVRAPFTASVETPEHTSAGVADAPASNPNKGPGNNSGHGGPPPGRGGKH